MQLTDKGTSAPLPEIKQLQATMSWTTAADFDLMAALHMKDGSWKMVYFGDKGSLTSFPFINLDEDAGIGDTGGDNQETIRIAKMDDTIDRIVLCCADYGALQKGAPARFDGSDLHIEVKDEKGEGHDVAFDNKTTGNFVCLLSLTNTGITAQVENVSAATTLKAFNGDDVAAFLNTAFAQAAA